MRYPKVHRQLALSLEQAAQKYVEVLKIDICKLDIFEIILLNRFVIMDIITDMFVEYQMTLQLSQVELREDVIVKVNGNKKENRKRRRKRKKYSLMT